MCKSQRCNDRFDINVGIYKECVMSLEFEHIQYMDRVMREIKLGIE